MGVLMDIKSLMNIIKSLAPPKPSSSREVKKNYEISLEAKDSEEVFNELEKVKKVKKLLEMVPEEEVEEVLSEEPVEEAKGKEEVELEDNFPEEQIKEPAKEEEQKLFKRMPSTVNKISKVEKGGKKMLKIGIPYLDDHIEPSLSLPKLLSFNIEERAEEEVRDVLEAKTTSSVDKSELTQRILALTKEFLSEKDIKKKRKISEEIRRLKQSVALQSSKKVDLLNILSKRQQDEVKQILDEIKEEVETNIEACRKEYEQALLLAGNDASLINRINEQFIKDLNIIESQLTNVVRKALDFVKRLHLMELEKFVEKESIPPEKTEEIYKSIEGYEELFNKLFVELKELIERQKRDIKVTLESSFEETSQEEKRNVEDIVREVKDTREAVLLHTLRAKNRKVFFDYLKGTIPKEEALQIARRLLAKEMGLSDEEVDKYFPIGG